MENDSVDPLCKLIPMEHYRFCVAVSRSSYFAERIRYPQPTTSACSKEEVSFRTVEAITKAAGKPYFERMTLCRLEYENFREGKCFLYISRAYLSNAVFVYRRDPTDGKIYLENLSTNISIVDEINSFDLVEY